MAGASFAPLDPRSRIVDGLSHGARAAAERELAGILVADCYGDVQSVRWARDAYNAKLLVLDCA
jgi:hypothetical protein